LLFWWEIGFGPERSLVPALLSLLMQTSWRLTHRVTPLAMTVEICHASISCAELWRPVLALLLPWVSGMPHTSGVGIC
jgi:hypothetical protein